jgi:hypothetical protein
MLLVGLDRSGGSQGRELRLVTTGVGGAGQSMPIMDADRIHHSLTRAVAYAPAWVCFDMGLPRLRDRYTIILHLLSNESNTKFSTYWSTTYVIRDTEPMVRLLEVKAVVPLEVARPVELRVPPGRGWQGGAGVQGAVC